MGRIEDINLPGDAKIIRKNGIDIGISTKDASWDSTPGGQEFLGLKRGIVEAEEVEKIPVNS